MNFNYCPPLQLEDLKSQTFPDGKRYYTLPDGIKLPSVTTVLGALKKDAIMAWRRKVGEDVANAISKKATSRGTNVHTICENYLNNKDDYMKGIMPDALEMFISLKPYLNKINNIHYQEQALWSKQLGMAGRVDCIAEYEGELSVIDFKTSRKIKTKNDIEDYFWQTTAYSLMYEELIGKPIHNLVIIMAVEDNPPLIFKERVENHIDGLVKAIHSYKTNK
jgi:CRISPR/Cas system-associated exonuclease Cas4 (RecB family)